MDILNISACLGVILLHVSNHPLVNFEGVSVSFYWGALTHSISLWPVPIFYMLSGGNLIGREGSVKMFYRKRFIKTVIPFFAWSLIYAVLYHPQMGKKDYITAFVNGHINYHMWFFIPLFAIYLCVPFVNGIVKDMKQEMMSLFFWLTIVFIVICPFCFKILNIGYLEYSLFPIAEGFICYAILGYLIAKKDFLHEYKKTLFVSSIFFITGSFACIAYSLPHEISRDTVINYTSPFCFITSISVFLFFKNFNWDYWTQRFHLSPSLIQEISSCSFGIYLIHGGIRRFSDNHDLILTNPYVGAFLLYVISLAIIWSMKHIPLLKYIVP